ncbi:MAG: DegT/DnrJ/EryC1/StrS aminotransferase family protein [Chloroflexota bacterium]|nr:DegT/DnrJ/EryC1/StrS aminotransferase family protein [Chloroflexota bacterium]
MTAVRRPLETESPSRIPFARPDITDAEINAVVEVLRSGWLTTGPVVQRFEAAFASYLGAPHAVALNSATAALHLALDAIGLQPEDEVIVPTYTFTASAEVVRYFGARVVLVDVHPDDLNIDVAAVEKALTPRTRAIIGVDIAGQPCDWHLLRQLATGRQLALIDDAAHSLPSSLQGVPIGRWADLTAFSFYVTKSLATGEGGMLVTGNTEWAERARLMSLHGIGKDAWKRYSAEGSWYYEVEAAGFKYNMTDIAAALGVAQLGRLEEMYARRAAIASRYTEAFAELPELEVPSVRADRTTSWHLYVLRLHLDRLRCDRAQFIQSLAGDGVGVSVHFIPLHLHPYYRDAYGHVPDDFPVANREYHRALSLPIYSRMSDSDVNRVIAAVEKSVVAYRR